MKQLTLGSHFDGIAGFPLAASIAGIKAVWATEIEPFPIQVSKEHFPEMKHYGSITDVSGAELEPVDIITFGSPCTRLSVAGKHDGFDITFKCEGDKKEPHGIYKNTIRATDKYQYLYKDTCPVCGQELTETNESALFFHAIRTIREMREATNGIYPRIAVWENVPGAFSSNRGADFRAVLEALTEAEIPMPPSGKWAEAGMVRGNGRDIAWRVLDAQYWGVPQRRKRIFLVCDFGGECAAEILFERESLPGDIEKGRKAREEVAAGAGDGVEGTVYGLDQQGGKGGANYTENVMPTLCSNSHGTPHAVAQPIPILLYDMTHAEEVIRPVTLGLAPTLNARMGTGGNQIPVMMDKTPIAFGPGGQHDIAHAVRAQASRADKPSSTTYVIQSATMGGEKKQNGLGVSEGPCYTLDCRADHAVAHAVDCRNLYETPELSGTLQCKQTGGYSLNYQNPVRVGYAVRRLLPIECERLQGFPDKWTDIPGASDTARYKAIGNSIAIPCVAWIMQRIAQVLQG